MAKPGGIPLFNLFGFQVRVDPSWFFLAFLITWTLATGFFPFTYPGLTYGTYLWMGAFVALGLLFSIVIHEFAHSWVARHYGLPMGGITLFLFGGMAEMENEAPSPKVEFLMALAGPATSVIVMLGFLGLTWIGMNWQWPTPIIGITSYLGTINGVLALFNLIPAFPLDGGRILRSALWAWRDNLDWATRIASMLGMWFGMLLIIVGVLRIMDGIWLGGFWWVLIGLFVRNAARMGYQQLQIQQSLEGQSVRRFAQANVLSVEPELSLQQFADRYAIRSQYDVYPVVEHGRLIGCVQLEQLRKHPEDTWPEKTVRQIMKPCADTQTIHPDAQALEALNLMRQSRSNQLLIVNQHQYLRGILFLDNLLRYVNLQLAANKEEQNYRTSG